MTSTLGSVCTYGLAIAGAYVSGGTLLQKTWRGGAPYKSLLGRAAMATHAVNLAYTRAILANPVVSSGALTSALVALGAVGLGSLLVVGTFDSVFNPKKRFESFAGRFTETLGAFGLGASLVAVGSYCGVPPADAMAYAATGLISAMSSLGKGLAGALISS